MYARLFCIPYREFGGGEQGNVVHLAQETPPENQVFATWAKSRCRTMKRCLEIPLVVEEQVMV